TNGGTGNTASATITVGALSPPTIAKGFAPSLISVGETSALTFTITNPNASTALTGVAFSDPFPAGLVVATPNGLTGSCGGRTLTATAGAARVPPPAPPLAAAPSCTFSVNVTTPPPGFKTTTPPAATSTNGGTGNTASATLATSAGLGPSSAPTIAKSF